MAETSSQRHSTPEGGADGAAAPLRLGPAVEGAAVEALLTALQERLAAARGLDIDGRDVVRISTLALQVLVAARRSAARRSLGFTLAASPELARAAAEMGLTPHLSDERA